MARIFAVTNQKGGVGKTTTAVNLAAGLSRNGKKVCLVDLDPQGNSTHYLMGQPAADLKGNAAEFFEQTLSFNMFQKDPAEYVHATPFENLFVFPSNPELDFLAGKLEAKHKIFKLKNALRALENQFDEIIIDTAPALNFYTRSALIATDKVLIPFDCDDFSRQALYHILGELQDIQEDHNESLEVEGIVVNQFQPRASLPAKLVQELIDEGMPVVPVKLTSSIKMKESHQASKPLVYFAPKHALTLQFQELFHYLSEEKTEVEEVIL